MIYESGNENAMISRDGVSVANWGDIGQTHHRHQPGLPRHLSCNETH